MLFLRCPQGAAAAGGAGSHHADVRREPGGFADSAVLPERRHLGGGESDDSYERSCLSGPFPLPSQYSEERKLTEVSFFSTLVISLMQNDAFGVSKGTQDKIFQSICFPARVTQGMASVRGESPCCRARSVIVRAQKVFSQAQ